MLKNTGATALLVLSAVAAQGCIVHSYDTYEEPYTETEVIVVQDNYAPYVIDAEAGVYWDSWEGDDIWYFDAYVDDPDGPYDIISVWADVYDECRGGAYIQSFELYPTDDPYVWYSDWVGRSTYLNPFDDCYTVDFVAYDTFEDFGYTTVWALTY